jgi:L-methionine (R)-S-oxide reductase
VLPEADQTKTVAIIDMDCAVEDGFNEDDQRYLEELAALLADACEWQ